MVTTKRGKIGLPLVTYTGYVGFQNICVVPKVVDSYQFCNLKNAAALNVGLPAPYTDAEIQKYKDGSEPDIYPNHNPFKEFVDKNTIITNHNLQLSGGSEKFKYYASLGYLRQNGMWSTNNKDKYNFSVNLEAQATKTTEISINML